MKFKSLPNSTLILNGHKIHTKQELFDYINKRLSLYIPMTTIEQLQDYKEQYQIEHVTIRHEDTFLKDALPQEKSYLLSHLIKNIIR